jgi:hypothetical protein
MKAKNIFFLLMTLITVCTKSYSGNSTIDPVKLPVYSNGTVQCNTEDPLPLVAGTFDNLITSSSTTGVCLIGCGISNISRLIDSNLTNSATVSTLIGVGVTHRLRVTDGNDIFASGSFAGYRIAPGSGLISVDLLNSITIRTYLGGVIRETAAGASLISLTLLSNPGNYVLGFNTNLSFDAIEISLNSLAGVASNTNIYYPVIRNYCAGPSLVCNTPTALNLPSFPAAIENSHTGLSGVGLGSISNAENAVTSGTTDYAGVTMLADVLGTASLSIKDEVTDYPAGTYAGFDIENINLLTATAISNVVVRTYLNGVFKEQFSGTNLLVNGTLLSATGRNKLGFVATLPFDEVQLSLNQVAGVNLGLTKIYSAVFEKFCAGPTLPCNTQTAISAPTYPVYVDGTKTGTDGIACLLCSTTGTDNLIDANTANYANVDLTASIGTATKIAVKDQITDYPAGTFAGFDIEGIALLNANVLDGITVRTYLNGSQQESKTGNGPLISINTFLLVSSGRQTIGFVTTLPFDEIQIRLANVATVTLGTVRVYNAVLEKFCPTTVACNQTYAWTNPTFPVTVDGDKSGITGVACAACAVTNPGNVLTADVNDYARITVTAGVLAAGSLAVADQLFTYPPGTFAAFTIKDLNTLLEADLFQSLTISTYNNGALQEAKTGGQLISLSLLVPILGSGPGFYNVGFKATLPFDEIKIRVGSLASVISNVNVYGAFVNTKDSNDAGTGSLNCNTSDLSILKTANNATPAVGSNVTFTILASNVGPRDADGVVINDILPSGYNYVSSTVSTGIYNNVTGVWTIGNLNAGTNATLTITATVNATGSYANTATITGNQPDPNPNNNTSTSTPTPVNIITANDDVSAPINGYIGGTAFSNVLVNDTINGQPVTAAQVNTTFVSSTNAGITLSGTNVQVAPGTQAGTYTLTYQICEVIKPTNCDQAIVSVTVTAPAIDAVNDTTPPINGYTGGTFATILANDTLNGLPVNPAQVNTTQVSSSNPGVTLSGTNVIVASGTPAGTYTLTYQICEKVNPTNCDQAIVTVTVTAPAIDAVNDTGSNVNGYTGGTAFTNVLANDTLNGQPVNPAQVNTTQVSSSNLGVTLSGTNVIVASGTPAGTYTLTYQICEKTNPTNCDQAIVTVTVTAPAIDAVNDTGSNVNGYIGGTAFTNVLANDTLNGQPVNPAQVNTTFVSSTNAGITLSGTNVNVAAGTPAGFYSLIYQICEKTNPTNCDQATVSVTVVPPAIDAVNDTTPPINGYTGGTFATILGNDTLNGQPVNPVQVNTTFVSSTNTGITLSGTNVNIAAGTPAGAYSLVYRICEKTNPTNCDTATVTVTVTAPAIDAVNDTGSNVNGYTGGTSFTNVLGNDTLNGQPVNPAQVNTTFVSSTNTGITLSGTNVNVAAGTPAGSYSLIYQICEKTNPTNCDQATVTITVTAPAIDAVNDTGSNVSGYTGGTSFTNVLGNDTLNGQPVNPAQVNTTFVSSTNTGITLSGTNVNIAAGTPAGAYSLVYRICEKTNPANCDTATVTVTVTAPAIDAINDTTPPINGYTGGTFTNVLANDTLNGQPVNPAQVNTTFVSSTNAGITLSGTNVNVAAGTPAGTYSLVYRICEKTNPTNCDTATVTVTVTAPAIDAVNDTTPPINGYTGGTFTNVLANDTLNGQQVNTTQVNTTQVSSSNPGITLSGVNIIVNPGTPAGTYTVIYQICEKVNPTNCDQATVTVTVTSPAIDAVNDNPPPVNTTTGGTAIPNVLVNDTLNGQPAIASQVNTTVVSSTNAGITLSGTSVNVTAGTPPGSYTLIYQICQIINPANCDQATVFVTVSCDQTAGPAVSVTQPTCFVATGTITITSPTGSGYTYSINNGPYQVGTTFTGLTAAGYNVTFKNSNGCISSATAATINQQPATPAAPTVSTTQPTCTMATGTITITAPIGSGLTYSIGGTYQAGTAFSGLIPASYNVTVKNSSGCISLTTVAPVNTQPMVPAAPSVTVTQPNCSTATGIIAITAPVGSRLTYSINSSTYQSNATFNNVAPATYNVTVKNSNGCISSATVVTLNAQPTIPVAPTITISPPTCAAANGSITIAAPIGSGLTYSINNSNYQSGTLFASVTPGSYNVTVKNSGGCTSPATLAVVSPQPTTCNGAGIFHTNVTCTDYRNNSSSQLVGQMCYSTRSNKVSNVTPGQFFYFTSITAPSASFCVDVLETKSCSDLALFAIQQSNQITLYNANCSSIAGGTQISLGLGRICISNATPGAQYVLSVKYDSKSIVNAAFSGTAPVCQYNFESRINGVTVSGSTTSINLVPNCSIAKTSDASTNDLVAVVAPNPSMHDFGLKINSTSSENITVRVIDINGRIINKFNAVSQESFHFGSELSRGLYFIEITQGIERRVIKAQKL